MKICAFLRKLLISYDTDSLLILLL